MFSMSRDYRSLVLTICCVALSLSIGCYGEPESPADLVVLDG